MLLPPSSGALVSLGAMLSILWVRTYWVTLTLEGRHGSQIVVPYRGEESSYNHLKVMGDLGQIIPMKWDFRDKDSIRRAAEYSNVIINLTGRRWDTRNFTQKQANVDSAKAIAEVAKELGVERLIHVSALGAQDMPSDWGKTKVKKHIKEILQVTVGRRTSCS